MKVPGLSKSTGHKVLPAPFVTTVPTPFVGREVDNQDELDKLWENGEISKLAEVPETPYVPTGINPVSDFKSVMGRDINSLPGIVFPTQPTIFGPQRMTPNILELRRKFGVA